MISSKDLYGDGCSARRIVNLVKWRLQYNNTLEPPIQHYVQGQGHVAQSESQC